MSDKIPNEEDTALAWADGELVDMTGDKARRLLAAEVRHLRAALAAERAKREGPSWNTGLPKDEGLYLVQTQSGDLVLLEDGALDWLVVERWIGPFEKESPAPDATARELADKVNRWCDIATIRLRDKESAEATLASERAKSELGPTLQRIANDCGLTADASWDGNAEYWTGRISAALRDNSATPAPDAAALRDVDVIAVRIRKIRAEELSGDGTAFDLIRRGDALVAAYNDERAFLSAAALLRSEPRGESHPCANGLRTTCEICQSNNCPSRAVPPEPRGEEGRG